MLVRAASSIRSDCTARHHESFIKVIAPYSQGLDDIYPPKSLTVPIGDVLTATDESKTR